MKSADNLFDKYRGSLLTAVRRASSDEESRSFDLEMR